MNSVWIERSVFDRMTLEADAKYPLETGGILAGYCSIDDDEVVITEIVGPGPNAKHRRSTYRPDYKFHRDEIGKIYEKSNGLISYLGDWHTHPSATAHLSWIDRRALRNIAREPRNYMDRPVMIILGESSGGEKWSPRAWRTQRVVSTVFWPQWEYFPLGIKVF
ncbi:Mov34/MPN/PAD-1 family protein [Syntrophotalea acetylenivorans]